MMQYGFPKAYKFKVRVVDFPVDLFYHMDIRNINIKKLAPNKMDNILKCIFCDEKFCISIQNLLKLFLCTQMTIGHYWFR